MPLALVAVCAIAWLASPATASVRITPSDDPLNLLQEFEKSKCKVKTDKFGFLAFSLPAEDLYTLDVFIKTRAWKGPGHTYDLLYGGDDVTAYVFGPHPHEVYSNQYGIPNTPPNTVSTGAIKVSANGKRFSIGAYGLSDDEFTAGVSVAGSAKCRYPRK